VFKFETAAVQSCNRRDQAQPQTGAWRAAARIAAVESLDDFQPFSIGYSRAGIGHPDTDRAPWAAPHLNADAAALRRIVERVIVEIAQRLRKKYWIAAHRGRPIAHHGQCAVLELRSGLVELDRGGGR